MKILQFTKFEHQKLCTDEKSGFKDRHLKALQKWYYQHIDKDGICPYFSLCHNGIKFKHWVGILEVDNVFIEVLPKVSENDTTSDDIWRKRLIKMLRYTRTIDIRTTDNASQSTCHTPLWEIFYRHYIALVKELLHSGLIKSYKQEVANRNALKGKLLFSKHIVKNCAHQEKFYTQATVYNRDTLANQILIQAVRVIASSPSVQQDAKMILSEAEDIHEINAAGINWERVARLKEQRKTVSYTQALAFAELILRGSNPAIKKGEYNVTAIMFDMNKLFEKYVYRKMKEILSDWSVQAQLQEKIWRSRVVKPDIVCEKDSKKIIFDTKWKKLESEQDISNADIYQMFIYCKKFEAREAFLIYPWYKDKVVDDKICNNFEEGKTIEIDHLQAEQFQENCIFAPYLGIIFWKFAE